MKSWEVVVSESLVFISSDYTLGDLTGDRDEGCLQPNFVSFLFRLSKYFAAPWKGKRSITTILRVQDKNTVHTNFSLKK